MLIEMFVWDRLCTDIQIQTLFVEMFTGNRFFREGHINNLSLEEIYRTLFNYIMILLRGKLA